MYFFSSALETIDIAQLIGAQYLLYGVSISSSMESSVSFRNPRLRFCNPSEFGDFTGFDYRVHVGKPSSNSQGNIS